MFFYNFITSFLSFLQLEQSNPCAPSLKVTTANGRTLKRILSLFITLRLKNLFQDRGAQEPSECLKAVCHRRQLSHEHTSLVYRRFM